MIIEWLKVSVSPALREKYIQKDEEIWTAFLATCPGFLGKEVWTNPDKPEELILIVRWATREHWKSIPDERLEDIEQQFVREMEDSYPFVETAEYQVRKLP